MTNETEFVVQLLESTAETMPTRVAVVDDTGEHTYHDLNRTANQVAGWLRQAGIHAGDRVLLAAANSARLVAAIFGALKAGVICVPIHPATTVDRLAFLIADCAPAAFVLDPSFLQTHASLLGSCNKPILLTQDSVAELPDQRCFFQTWTAIIAYGDRSPQHVGLTTDLAAIIYTSGSTKNPRGVMLPNRQVVFATTAINSVIGNTAHDVILCGLPLSFDYGLYQVFLACQVGAKLILERDFSLPIKIPYLLEHHQVTGFPGVPSIFGMLLRSRLLQRTSLNRLRYLTSTGDVFPVAYIRELQQLLPHVTIFPMYGLTECKRVSIMPRGELQGREDSVGKPLPGTQVFVADDAGNSVPMGMTGELVVCGPHVMTGYWNDPEETRRRFRICPDSQETVLYTGDYFRMDEAGFLYYVGRGEQFIKSRGHKISPLEIEACIYELAGVAEVAAVGVPDAILGESIHVFVAAKDRRQLQREQIEEHCRRRLPPVARPNQITIVDYLPKTENGKIDRLRLRIVHRSVAAQAV